MLVAHDEHRLRDLARRLHDETGRSIDVLRADLTDPADLSAVATRIEEDAAVDLLINNAGMSLRGSVVDEDPATVTRLIALNITATTRLAGAAARAFPDHGRAGAAIVNISSVLALAPEQFDGVYSGSKAYLLNLSLWLAHALADKGVHVQAVLPGATRTEIWERSGKSLDAMPAEMVMEVGEPSLRAVQLEGAFPGSTNDDDLIAAYVSVVRLLRFKDPSSNSR